MINDSMYAYVLPWLKVFMPSPHSRPHPRQKKKKLWKPTPLYFVIMRSKQQFSITEIFSEFTKSWDVLKC